MRQLTLGILFTFSLLLHLRAEEVQSHGVLFERWVRETFFAGYQPRSATQLWDIPAEANTEHGDMPVNPKAIKFRAPVDLGDALRQFGVAERGEHFLLLVGFWEQEGPVKKWVHAVNAEVTAEQYRALWSPITLKDLRKLDALVKDQSLSLEDARKQAQAMKQRPPFSKAIMQVNPKIDSTQRRLQCSLRFGDFFHFLAPEVEPLPQENPQLFGVALPENFISAPRALSR
jgi:hypothetical protein